MSERYLTIRAHGGRELCAVTDEDIALPADLALGEAVEVIRVLGEHVQGFHRATGRGPSALAGENRRLKDRIAELEAGQRE